MGEVAHASKRFSREATICRKQYVPVLEERLIDVVGIRVDAE
jgi:hypothetical protein